MGESKYLVKPVHKALQVLDYLARENRELSLSEISRRINLPKTTVYRYLHTLSTNGLVAHDHETDCYRLGVRLWELGQLVGGQLPVGEVALPYMQQLRDRFNETVNLGILDGTEIVYVEMAQGGHALRMHAALGGRDPAHSTSLGKAILAHLRDGEWRQHVPARLSKRTRKTITSISALKQELEETRRRGFARDNEENEEGARCIGAPIFDRTGNVVAALSVSAPAARLNDALEPRVAEAVVQAAKSISERLGNLLRK